MSDPMSTNVDKDVNYGADSIQVLEGLAAGDRVFIDIPPGFKEKMMGDGGK